MTWQALATEHLPLAKRIAARMARRMPMDPGDIESAAMLGLVQAAQAFKPEVGGNFPAFAETRIKGAIQDEARATDHLSRDHRKKLKASGEAGPTHVDFESIGERVSARAPGAEEVLANVEEVRKAMRHLPRKMQTVVRMHFLDGLTLRQVGEHLGFTEARACQIAAEAAERMRYRLLPYEAAVDPAERRKWARSGGCTRRREACLRGHPLTGRNVLPGRACRRCRTEATRRLRWLGGTIPFDAYRPSPHKLRKLTDAQVREVLERLARGEGVTAIGRSFGVAQLVVRFIRDGRTYRDVARPLGFTGKRRQRGKLSQVEASQIVRRLQCGELSRKLALEYMVSPATISDIRCGRYHRAAGAVPLEDGRRLQNGKRKLTDLQVLEARAELAKGAIVASVARRFGVSFNAMKALRDGVSYKRIQAPTAPHPSPPARRAPAPVAP